MIIFPPEDCFMLYKYILLPDPTVQRVLSEPQETATASTRLVKQ